MIRPLRHGLVDLDRRMVIDLVEGNAAADLRRWCSEQDRAWLGDIATVAIDLPESYRAGLWPHVVHAERVAYPLHVVRVANRCVDTGDGFVEALAEHARGGHSIRGLRTSEVAA